MQHEDEICIQIIRVVSMLKCCVMDGSKWGMHTRVRKILVPMVTASQPREMVTLSFVLPASYIANRKYSRFRMQAGVAHRSASGTREEWQEDDESTSFVLADCVHAIPGCQICIAETKTCNIRFWLLAA